MAKVYFQLRPGSILYAPMLDPPDDDATCKERCEISFDSFVVLI